MTIDQALFEMELVGHDFFLFTDAAAGLPSVVYRRRGYEYGVIRLVEEALAGRRCAAPGWRTGGRSGAANLASGLGPRTASRPADRRAGQVHGSPGRREFEHCHRYGSRRHRAAAAGRQVRRGMQHGRQRRQRARPALGQATSAEPIRTMIVDDHALFRRGLEMVLESEPDIELVGEASDGAEAVEKAGETLPDVVLMDIRMPRSSGIEACRALKDVVAQREDRHADDQRRGRGPVRGDPRGRERLPAQGHPA